MNQPKTLAEALAQLKKKDEQLKKKDEQLKKKDGVIEDLREEVAVFVAEKEKRLLANTARKSETIVLGDDHPKKIRK